MKFLGIDFKFNGFDLWHKGNLTKVSQLTNDSGFTTPTGHSHKSIDYTDSRSTNHNGFDYKGISIHLKSNSIDGLNDGGTYHGVIHLTQWGDISGGKAKQLAFTDNGNIWIRDWNGTTWSQWTRIAKISDIPTKLSQLENDIGAGGGINIVTSPTEPSNLNPGDWWFKEL